MQVYDVYKNDTGTKYRIAITTFIFGIQVYTRWYTELRGYEFRSVVEFPTFDAANKIATLNNNKKKVPVVSWEIVKG